MTDAEITKLANEIKKLETRYSRKQTFEYHTRHLSDAERAEVKKAVVEKMRK